MKAEHVEKKKKESEDDLKHKIVSERVVRNLIEKMRIKMKNTWTLVSDVTSNPQDTKAVTQMVANGLLEQEKNLVRFANSKLFSVIDSNMK